MQKENKGATKTIKIVDASIIVLSWILSSKDLIDK
jgi:hypothetical protein